MRKTKKKDSIQDYLGHLKEISLVTTFQDNEEATIRQPLAELGIEPGDFFPGGWPNLPWA